MFETHFYKLNLWIPAGHSHAVAIGCRQKTDVPLFHTHEFAEMTFLTSGMACHFANGKQQIIKPGQVLFIRPEHCHALQPMCDDTTIYNLMLLPSVLNDFAHRFFNGQLAFWASSDSPRVRQLKQDELDRTVELFEQLQQEPASRFYLEKCLFNLFAAISILPDTDSAAVPPEWLHRAIVAFRDSENPEMLNSLDLFFKLCARTPNHVARLCRQFYGCTPGQVLQHYRLERAARLLIQSTKDIHDVAHESGYPDLSNFYKQFKKQFGTTPRKYRQNKQVS